MHQHLHQVKCSEIGFKIILMYLPSNTNFVYVTQHCKLKRLGNNPFLIWEVGGLGFKKKCYALADRKNIRFCKVAGKKNMMSPRLEFCYGKMYFCST